MSARFGRVVTAMVSPFREDLSLDLDEAQRLARHLVDSGVEGLVITGSTGEAATMSNEERTDLFRAVKEAVGDGAKVVCSTGTHSTAISVELSQDAEKAGADGLLVVTPYYNKPPQDALLDHFRTVADSTGLPVILYDIPGRTALKIEVDTLLRAAEHPRIVALKESAGDLSALARFCAEKPDDFDLYSGNDDWTLPLQALGAVGVVSVAAHLVAGRIREQFDAFARSDLAEARKIQLEIIPLARALLFTASNPIPVKAALEMIGFRVGAPRPPLRRATDEEQKRIRQALEQLGVL